MTSFYYRRRLERQDWMRLIGAGAGAGLGLAGVIVYFGRLWLQRVPVPSGDLPAAEVGSGGPVRHVTPPETDARSRS